MRGGVYSTSELKCGTWIDGKTLYRKVVIINAPRQTASITTYPHGIANISEVVMVYGSLTSGAWKASFPNVSETSWDIVGADKTNVQINWYGKTISWIDKAIVIVEYTKTN